MGKQTGNCTTTTTTEPPNDLLRDNDDPRRQRGPTAMTQMMMIIIGRILTRTRGMLVGPHSYCQELSIRTELIPEQMRLSSRPPRPPPPNVPNQVNKNGSRPFTVPLINACNESPGQIPHPPSASPTSGWVGSE